MISMKPSPTNPIPPQMIQTEASIKAQIRIIKNCLKQDYLYSNEEIHQLKKELRSLNEQRTALKVSNGF